ncbi:MAG: FimV/HubP family polar landmark protein [Betaproteobacteria bacterium]
MAKKIHQTLNRLRLRSSVLAVFSCLALSGISLDANAAGLGKIVVFSALGQPLRAEIEVSATRDELSDMRVQLASQDSFKQAGLDYAATLQSLRFNLDKRPSGQSVIKLTSTSPINDPFVDMLLELNWPSGRLVREYTFLLDPPEVAAKNAALVVPVSTPASSPVPVAAPRSPAPVAVAPREKTPSSKPRVQEPARPADEQPSEAKQAIEVKRGDTLHRIAVNNKPAGVSLDQMLVGLYRANQDAFDGKNMNRLKTGKILTVPEKSALEEVSTSEARKIILTQSSDWNAYRSKVATAASQAPVSDSGARQQVAGKITAKVEEKAATSSEPKDQLKVSKTESTGAQSAAAAKRGEEDLVAKEKALKEANERLNLLEKNVSNLQKLLDLKNQNLAELQKQAAEKSAPLDVKKPVEEVKQAAPSAPVAVAPPVKPEPVPATVAVAEKPVEPTKPGVIKEEAKPVMAPAPEPTPAELPKPKPKPVVPPPPPLPEPSLVDDLLDNPLALGGGAGVLALLAAFFVLRRRSGNKDERLDLSTTELPQVTGSSDNSVFRSTGGQSVDTSHTPVHTDFSQAGPGSIDTDEVDPVAEADVYMAYGRDAQAEEILLEALQKDQKRYAIHLKLLEIYLNRKDVKRFETVATELYSETGGAGADWEKAVAMGLKINPANPMFGGAASAAAQPFDADATVIVDSTAMNSTVTLPGMLVQLAEKASQDNAASVAEQPIAAADLTSLDFDLGLGEATSAVASSNAPVAREETPNIPEPVAADSGPLDFDLDAFSSAEVKKTAPVVEEAGSGLDFELPEIPASEPPKAEVRNEVADLDFDLGFDAPSKVENAAVQSVSAPVLPEPAPEILKPEAEDDDSVEFDVKMTESSFLGRSIPLSSSFDMSSIDLDLEVPGGETPSTTSLQETPGAKNDHSEFFDFDKPVAFSAPADDVSASHSDTIVAQPIGADLEDLPEFEISANEEVATKLDLAKAYEEMGDNEGARELLQEVLTEGDPSQREKAQLILSRIAG